MEKLCFKVADLCFSIEAPSASMIKKLLPSYAPFYVAEGEDSNSMLCVVVNNGVVDANAEGEELGQFDCGGTNHGVYRLAEGYKVVISTVTAICSWVRAARVRVRTQNCGGNI